MYIYKNNYGVLIVSLNKPINHECLEIDSLPDGDGKLCTDFKTVWREPWPTPPVPIISDSVKLKAQQERIDFLEDCIAEMAGVIYS